jgi:hypothetical protein
VVILLQRWQLHLVKMQQLQLWLLLLLRRAKMVPSSQVLTITAATS